MKEPALRGERMETFMDSKELSGIAIAQRMNRAPSATEVLMMEDRTSVKRRLNIAVNDGELSPFEAQQEYMRYMASTNRRYAEMDVMYGVTVGVPELYRAPSSDAPWPVSMDNFEPFVEPPRRARAAVVEKPVGDRWKVVGPVPSPEYLEVAERIGLKSLPVMKSRVEHFLANVVGWPVYRYERVMAYLQYIADRDTGYAGDGGWAGMGRTVPTWLPFREKDRKGAGNGHHQLYEREVPLHALQKIDRVEAEFPEAPISFWVSDYKVERPDPFLMMKVCQNETARWVIDVWDEPGWSA
jgi:hypothetical protein